jgi:hypothetical protein
MKTQTSQQRLATAIQSLEEYLQGVWQGEEGIQAIIDSLRIVQQETMAQASQLANAPTHEELIQIVRAYGYALDMSDSEHPYFRDSNADVVEYLREHEATVRRILGSGSSAAAAP